jgi:hypothetical protein
MVDIDRGHAGLAATIALALLAGLLFANLMFVNASTEHKISHVGTEVSSDERRVVAGAKVPAEPGDRVSLELYTASAATSMTFDRVELFVVEDGYGQAFVNETAPTEPYLHRDVAADASGGGALGETVTLTRPAVDEAAPEPEFDFPGDRLDVVWVFHVADGASLPENETARNLFIQGLETPGADRVAITDGAAVEAQPWFYAGEGLLALAAVGLGLAALRGRRGSPAPSEEAAGAEALIGLVEEGERYLANLRNLLLVTGGLLFFLGMFGVVALDDVFLLAIAPGGPSAGWDAWITRGFAFVWLALVATWLVLLVVVQRALNRWRSNLEERPLDL